MVQLNTLGGLESSMREMVRAILSSRTPVIVFVALTAHAMRNEQEKSIRSGCNDYLTKPIDTARLKEVLMKHEQRQKDTEHLVPLA